MTDQQFDADEKTPIRTDDDPYGFVLSELNAQKVYLHEIKLLCRSAVDNSMESLAETKKFGTRVETLERRVAVVETTRVIVPTVVSLTALLVAGVALLIVAGARGEPATKPSPPPPAAAAAKFSNGPG